MTSDRLAARQRFIEEFRASAGKPSGDYQDVPVLLLHAIDSTSGDTHVTPLTCQPLDDHRWAVFASNSGGPADPAWYLSLLTNSQVTIEFGPDTIPVTARITEGEERAQIWTRQKELMPSFAGYEQTANRPIPVVVFERHR